MKLAVASMDTHEVSGHLGHCTTFVIYEIAGERVLERQIRQLEGEGGCQCHGGGIFEAIGDCDAVLAGGMGQGLCNKLTARGIAAVVTPERVADEAVARYLAGSLGASETPSCTCEH